MLLSDALTNINYALRGTDDDVPTFGGDESDYWVSVINSKKDELYYNVGKKWSYAHKTTFPNEPGTVATTGTTTLTGTNTFFTDYAVGDKITVSGETERTIASISSDTSLTVTVAFSNTASSKTFTRKIIIDDGVQSYSVPRSFLGASDKIYVLKTDGSKTYYDLSHPEENDYVNQQVYIDSVNPQKLVFTQTIDSDDPIVGGTLYLPGYYLPADVSAETDVLPVPDPNWLVMAAASEIAFNDVVYETKAPDLNEKANALFRQMVVRNTRGTYGKGRSTPYNIYKIRNATR